MTIPPLRPAGSANQVQHSVVASDANPTFTIGSRDEFLAALPLRPSQEFLATNEQRSDIGNYVFDQVLAEFPVFRGLGWLQSSPLRDEIMRRAGLDSAMASLIILGRRAELDTTWTPERKK